MTKSKTKKTQEIRMKRKQLTWAASISHRISRQMLAATSLRENILMKERLIDPCSKNKASIKFILRELTIGRCKAKIRGNGKSLKAY